MIDTHTHFYDPSRPEGVPWPPADNELLYRTVLPEHFRAVASSCGVTRTVVVEASNRLDDNDWILALAKDEPAIAGFVGHVEPQWDDAGATVARLADNALFRGIRLHRGHLGDGTGEELRAVLRALADHDLELDVLVNAEELPVAAAIARAFPSLRIVINHVAHVLITGGPPDETWTDALRETALSDNVFMKVSGFVERAETQPAPADPAYYAPTFDALWTLFGEDRLLYGSNWPVCERSAPYGTVFAIADAWFSDRGEIAREKVFVENARRAYRLPER